MHATTKSKTGSKKEERGRGDADGEYEEETYESDEYAPDEYEEAGGGDEVSGAEENLEYEEDDSVEE